ncbi:hypothetical protein [Clostridium sp.]|uniref:hypothetical protein n=1 Tax=Clostridium sp. TaxID=1506 RepID=UPI001B71F004|nr:hypothetical protein [Clostridium sp.]MBP3915616.1 hypothetical protein [Clostridium sp.]
MESILANNFISTVKGLMNVVIKAKIPPAIILAIKIKDKSLNFFSDNNAAANVIHAEDSGIVSESNNNIKKLLSV